MSKGISRRHFLKAGGGAFAAAYMLGVAGCGGGGEGGQETELGFANWTSAEEASEENVLKVLEAFQEENGNVGINNNAIPFDQMRQQLLNQASGGNPPDVMQVSGPWSQELGGNGALMDLYDMAGEDYIADNNDGAIRAGEYDGGLYAAPLSLTAHGFWFNKDLMSQADLDPESPPTTIDELNAQMDQINSRLGDQDVYSIGLDTTRIDYALVQFWPWFFAFGARPLYDGEVNFDTPEVGDALKWMRSLTSREYAPTGQQIKEIRELLADDKVAFVIDGPYLRGILRSLNPELEGDAFYEKFGVTTVPVGANDEPETLADIHQISISSQAADAEAAWEFCKYFIGSNTAVNEYHIPYGAIPALKSDQEGNEDLQDPVSQAYINEILPSMVAGPYTPDYGEAQQAIISALQQAAVEDTPIDQILSETEGSLQATYGD